MVGKLPLKYTPIAPVKVDSWEVVDTLTVAKPARTPEGGVVAPEPYLGFWLRKVTVHPPLAVTHPPSAELPTAPLLVANTTGVPSATGLPFESASKMVSAVVVPS